MSEPQRENEHLARATAEANELFGNLGRILESLDGDTSRLDVLDVANKAGLEIDDGVLEELKIDRIIYPLPWLPWHFWFPWRPLWCWWWHRRYPYYRCCPYWWHRCHWYPW